MKGSHKLSKERQVFRLGGKINDAWTRTPMTNSTTKIYLSLKDNIPFSP